MFKIGRKNLFLFGTLVIAILPTLVGSVLFINLNSETICHDLLRSMQMIGNDQYLRVTERLAHIQNILIMLSKNSSFRENRICEMNELINYTQYNLAELTNIFVLDANNMRIAGYSEDIIDEEKLSRYVKVRSGQCVTNYYMAEETNLPVIEILVPLQFSDEQAGWGVIGALIDPQFLNDIMALTQLYGEEVESYIIDQDGYFITNSRFVPHVIGKLRLDVEQIKYHINYSKDEGYLDYRGREVVGVYFPFEETGWTLIVESDKSLCSQKNDLIIRASEGFALAEVVLMGLYHKYVGKKDSFIAKLLAGNDENEQ